MIVFLTTILILLCLFIILLVMLQRSSGGMGSALGGGAADQMLGAGSGAQLTKYTVWSVLGFFVLSFTLYVFYQKDAGDEDTLRRTSGTPSLGDPATGLGSSGTSPVSAPPATSSNSNPQPSQPSSESGTEDNVSVPVDDPNASRPSLDAPTPSSDDNASPVPIPVPDANPTPPESNGTRAGDTNASDIPEGGN